MGVVAGRYESWFLSARDAEPGRPPRALWIRHTTHRSAGPPRRPRARSGARCSTPRAARPRRSSSRCRSRSPGGPARGFKGEARARGRMAEWELTLTGGGPPMRHLRPSALYRLPLPRTKLEAPVPDGIASGHVVLDGALVDVVGWRATVGHNWGAEHAERWVWLHAAGFEDEPETWLELAIARVRIGGALTPWIANGAVAHRRPALPARWARPRGGRPRDRAPGPLEAIVPGEPRAHPRRRPRRPRPDRRLPLRGRHGDAERSEREVLHAGLADVHLRIRRPGRSSAELAATAGGAYELGGREFTRASRSSPTPTPSAASANRQLARARDRLRARVGRGHLQPRAVRSAAGARLLGRRMVSVVVPAFRRRFSDTTVSLRPAPAARAVGRSTVSLAVTRQATAQRTFKRTRRLPRPAA